MSLFFDDVPVVHKKHVRKGAMPPIPAACRGWKTPALPYHYVNAHTIGVDTETREMDFEHGAGWGKGRSFIAGVSLAAMFNDGHVEKCYLPMRHKNSDGYNMDVNSTLAFLRDLLGRSMPKVGANILYDAGTLAAEGVWLGGRWHDIQAMEALFSDDGYVGLDYLGTKYLGRGKASDGMYDYIRAAWPNTSEKKLRQHIWEIPAPVAAHYAEDDAELPLLILQRQWPIMIERGLKDVYDMECELLPLLVKMRLEGVSIDLGYAEELHAKLGVEIEQDQAKLDAAYGWTGSVDSGRDLARLFDSQGIKYGFTDAGAPSFTKEYLKGLVGNPVVDSILAIREKSKIRGTFLESYLINGNVNGKVHCDFNPLRADEGGTRSGRLSASNPNLQNIPSRSDLGKLVRKCFIPDYGHFCWQSSDYSQIEYRMLCHFAVGMGADEVRAEYNNNPMTDYHVFTQALVKAKTGLEIPRKPIKNINFGLLYGMGIPLLTRQLGITRAESDSIFSAYHQGAPYVQATMDWAAQLVHREGIARTIMGRLSYFDKWSPRGYHPDAVPMDYAAAIRAYGSQIERAHTHKAINRTLQGSAADVMKKSMVDCYKSGIFDQIGVPRLTVHDELDFSVRDDSPATREGFKEMQHIMENSIRLRVPVIVESDRGRSWGELG